MRFRAVRDPLLIQPGTASATWTARLRKPARRRCGLATLEADAGAAAAADAAARDLLAKAADQAMQRTALDMVTELRDVEAKAGRLRVLIGGLSAACSVNDPPLNWSVSQVTCDPVHPYMVEGAGPNWAGAAATWRAYCAALKLDADASLPDDAPLPPGLAT